MNTHNLYFHGEIRKIFTGYCVLSSALVFILTAVMNIHLLSFVSLPVPKNRNSYPS